MLQIHNNKNTPPCRPGGISEPQYGEPEHEPGQVDLQRSPQARALEDACIVVM
jgi:hypothetical protein